MQISRDQQNVSCHGRHFKFGLIKSEEEGSKLSRKKETPISGQPAACGTKKKKKKATFPFSLGSLRPAARRRREKQYFLSLWVARGFSVRING